MHDRPTTPQSPAVDVAQTQLSPKPHTPQIDPEMHGSEDLSMKAPANEQEDSFVGTIGSRTPAKITRTETFDSEQNEDNTDNHSEDSFVEKIVARSPAKSITRIEDFVEAIDALEDAIEEIGECLPAVSVAAQSPAMDNKASKIVRGPTKATTPKSALKENKIGLVKSALKENKIASPKPAMKKMSAGRPSTVKSTPIPPKVPAGRPSAAKPFPAPAPAKKTPARPSNISSIRASLPPKPARQSSTSTGAKPGTSTTTSAPAPNRLVSSTHKPPFLPTKSRKPPTRPSFSLPGDAISLKQREQRAARLLADEAATAQKRQFKARPVRVSAVPVVKPTAASRARMSLAHEVGGEERGVRIKPLPRVSSVSTSDSKALSTLSVAKRGSTTADMSATGATGTARQLSSAQQQKLRGKEVFRRERLELEERERARREKEEAAKRARVEAAERGRLASREWAEKEKLRKVAKGV